MLAVSLEVEYAKALDVVVGAKDTILTPKGVVVSLNNLTVSSVVDGAFYSVKDAILSSVYLLPTSLVFNVLINLPLTR